MLGWYNPWPIGQGTCDAFRTNGRHTGVGWKKVFPVAGAGQGQSFTILGPWTLREIPCGHPPLLRQPHPSFRSRSLLSARVFSSPTHHPREHLGARIATSGHIDGNDLPGQGQRLPHQCLQQWNRTIKALNIFPSYTLFTLVCFPCAVLSLSRS